MIENLQAGAGGALEGALAHPWHVATFVLGLLFVTTYAKLVGARELASEELGLRAEADLRARAFELGLGAAVRGATDARRQLRELRLAIGSDPEIRERAAVGLPFRYDPAEADLAVARLTADYNDRLRSTVENALSEHRPVMEARIDAAMMDEGPMLDRMALHTRMNGGVR